MHSDTQLYKQYKTLQNSTQVLHNKNFTPFYKEKKHNFTTLYKLLKKKRISITFAKKSCLNIAFYNKKLYNTSNITLHNFIYLSKPLQHFCTTLYNFYEIDTQLSRDFTKLYNTSQDYTQLYKTLPISTKLCNTLFNLATLHITSHKFTPNCTTLYKYLTRLYKTTKTLQTSTQLHNTVQTFF